MTLPYQEADFVINQAGAGTTEIIAAVPYRTIRVVSYGVVMDDEGTFAFSDGTDWKTGDFAFAANGGISEVGTAESPLFVCPAGRPLQCTTVGAAAAGRVRIQYR
jgi:hypothetical protein